MSYFAVLGQAYTTELVTMKHKNEITTDAQVQWRLLTL